MTTITPEPPRSAYSTQRRIADRFREFHDANPEVYDELVALARRAADRGHRRMGIDMLFNIVRWNRLMSTVDTDRTGFKLNNDFRSHYARLIMSQEPDLEGLFETRALHAS